MWKVVSEKQLRYMVNKMRPGASELLLQLKSLELDSKERLLLANFLDEVYEDYSYGELREVLCGNNS